MGDSEDDDPLSRNEIRQLRHMLEAEKRAVWLSATIKVYSTWFAALVVALTLGWDFFKKIILTIKS